MPLCARSSVVVETLRHKSRTRPRPTVQAELHPSTRPNLASACAPVLVPFASTARKGIPRFALAPRVPPLFMQPHIEVERCCALRVPLAGLAPSAERGNDNVEIVTGVL